MKLTFIELMPFEEYRKEFLSDEEFRLFQNELMDNPEKGELIPGLGGLRKVRIADSLRHKGKRGGARVIYYYYVVKNRIYFVTAYGKNKQTDITNEQKQNLKFVAERIKALL
ncbi:MULTISPECIES: type II toxin-antitoxin system RelE/ParE family toxin [unclassified Lonepinella]|uniref:type II toxin-antitoxin system RelE/ParE family toxin n=1 Tax=unclassified Lonepinella TaxID=2642006 RepID=UPI0036DEBFF5